MDLAELVGLVTATLNPMAAQQRVTLHTTLEQLGPVIADHGRITQVLFNYVSNAIKFNH